jgi:hypothetical protein
MGRIPTEVLIWDLKRYTRDNNLWDRVCFRCKQATRSLSMNIATVSYEQKNDGETLTLVRATATETPG